MGHKVMLGQQDRQAVLDRQAVWDRLGLQGRPVPLAILAMLVRLDRQVNQGRHLQRGLPDQEGQQGHLVRLVRRGRRQLRERPVLKVSLGQLVVLGKLGLLDQRACKVPRVLRVASELQARLVQQVRLEPRALQGRPDQQEVQVQPEPLGSELPAYRVSQG